MARESGGKYGDCIPQIIATNECADNIKIKLQCKLY